MYPWVQSRMPCLTQAKCSSIFSWCALYILMQHVFKFNDIIYIVNSLFVLLILITSYSYLLKELVLCHVSKQVMCCGGFLLFPVSWLTSCFLNHFLFPDSLPVCLLSVTSPCLMYFVVACGGSVPCGGFLFPPCNQHILFPVDSGVADWGRKHMVASCFLSHSWHSDSCWQSVCLVIDRGNIPHVVNRTSSLDNDTHKLMIVTCA